MSTETHPAVSEAMREAVLDVLCKPPLANTPNSTRDVICALFASEIARITGERDAAQVLADVRLDLMWKEVLSEDDQAEVRQDYVFLLLAKQKAAAEAETARLRAALKLAENPLSYRHATDPNGPGSFAVARALEAVRAALSSQEKTNG